MLCAALPGCLYIYQGDELGLEEVADLPVGQRRDPMFHLSDGRDPGRDGCRVPLPWTMAGPSFGFGPSDAGPTWLSQPRHWGAESAEAQAADPTSMLRLYRAMLRLRRELPGLAGTPMRWLPSPEGTLAFARGDAFINVTNLSAEPVTLPDGATVLLASSELAGSALPADTSAWLRPATDPPTLGGGGGGWHE
jgi:alpha-glucosidase